MEDASEASERTRFFSEEHSDQEARLAGVSLRTEAGRKSDPPPISYLSENDPLEGAEEARGVGVSVAGDSRPLRCFEQESR